jgi:hypothetical protein
MKQMKVDIDFEEDHVRAGGEQVLQNWLGAEIRNDLLGGTGCSQARKMEYIAGWSQARRGSSFENESMQHMHVNGIGEAVCGVIRNLDSSVSTEISREAMPSRAKEWRRVKLGCGIGLGWRYRV